MPLRPHSRSQFGLRALAVALTLGCGGNPRAELVPEPATGSVAPGDDASEPAFAVAVTIDDLPFAGPPRPGDTVDRATARLLGHASAAAAPVTGFVNCDRLDGHASVVREWLSAGPTLGNHTAGHMFS